MTQTLLLRAALALLITGTLTGCLAGTFGRFVLQAEQERLADLRAWEAGLQDLDCPGLGEAHTDLLAKQAELRDMDQRQDILRGRFKDTGCPSPEGL